MLEIKNTRTEIMKNDFDVPISRQDTGELRDITIETSKTKKQRVKKANGRKGGREATGCWGAETETERKKERKKGRKGRKEGGNIQELCDNYKGTAYV